MAVKTNLKVEEVLLKSIIPHPDMEDYREELGDIAGLADSIKTEGLKEPIGVQPFEEKGKTAYRLIYGKRRFLALKKLADKEKIQKVSCVIIDKSVKPGELVVSQLIENMQRKDFTFSEISNAVNDLIANGVKQKDIAQKLSLSTAYISRIVNLESKASESLKSAVDKDIIGFNKASDIAELSKSEQDKIIAKIVGGENKSEVINKVRKDTKKNTKVIAESKLRIALEKSMKFKEKNPRNTSIDIQIAVLFFVLGQTEILPVDVSKMEVEKPETKKPVKKGIVKKVLSEDKPADDSENW